MFPIRDDNPTLHIPFATYSIIGLNLASWIFIQGVGLEPALSTSVCKFGAIAGQLTGSLDPETRIPISKAISCVIGDSPRWITLLSHMFMHGGWLHIIGNMWFLFVFGDNVEDTMGSFRFIIFYLLCGLAAAGVQILSASTSAVPMVGASGAIGGVMGAYAVMFPRARVQMLVFLGFFITRIKIPAFLMLGYWFIIQLLSGLPAIGATAMKGSVAFWAHIGGFLAGIPLVFLFKEKKRMAQRRKITWN